MDPFEYLIQQAQALDINLVNAVWRLVLSMLLGCAIGYERKLKGQSAGIRTFSLIAMGSTLAMLLSIYVPQEYLGLKNGDPGRIAAQVVTGIGFLGAGAIIQMKGSVRGLTTAAGIWMVAAIGMCVGVGLYWLSVIATALILVILLPLERAERRWAGGVGLRHLSLGLEGIVTDLEPWRELLRREGIKISNLNVEYDLRTSTTSLNLIVFTRREVDWPRLLDRLRQLAPTTRLSLGATL